MISSAHNRRITTRDTYTESKRAIFSRITRWVGSPLEWSDSARALLIIVPTLFFQPAYIWLARHNAEALSLSAETADFRDRVELYRTVPWVFLLAAGMWFWRTGRPAKWFLYTTSILWYVNLGLATALYEPFNTFLWLTIAAVTLLLLIIVDWIPVITGLGLAAVIIESSAAGVLPGFPGYAPVYSGAKNLDAFMHPNWELRALLLSMLITALLIFMYVVSLWRDREASLASALAELGQASRDLETRVAVRTRELQIAIDGKSRSEMNWESLFQSAPDFIMVIDREGRIEKINRVLPGSKMEKVVGRQVTMMIPEPYGRNLAEALTRVFSENREQRVETCYDQPDGTVWFENRIAPLGSDPGRAILIATDVTARRRADQERQEMDVRIREKQRLESLGILAGGIAHDFNNLLNPILGQAGLLQKDLPADSPLQEAVRDIEIAASRSAEIVRQLLAFVGHSASDKKAQNLNELIQEMARLLRIALPANVQLNMDLSSAPVVANLDGSQVRQVILNLITNAAESIGSNPGAVAVSTRVMEYSETLATPGARFGDLGPMSYVVVQISDTGAGIPQSTLPRIFDPFFTTKPKGHGLGLAFILGIVRSHGGAVSVTSEPGKGTTFRIFFPLGEAVRQPAGLSAAARKNPSPAADCTVLVVDDEELNRSLARRILQRHGMTILEACDGAEAVSLFAKNRGAINCVLLDLTMPVMGGADALARIREIDRNVPVILMSGYDQDNSRAGYGEDSNVEFLQKPFSADDLLRRIAAVTGNEKARLIVSHL